MLKNVNGAEILQDFRKKLAEAIKNNKTMTKERLGKKIEKLEKKAESSKKR